MEGVKKGKFGQREVWVRNQSQGNLNSRRKSKGNLGTARRVDCNGPSVT